MPASLVNLRRCICVVKVRFSPDVSITYVYFGPAKSEMLACSGPG